MGYGGTDAIWLPDATPTSRVGYSGASQTIQVMAQGALDDAKHFETRQLAETVCESLASKDYVSEYLALYNCLLQRTRYMRDPRRTELVKAPYIISKQILAGHRPSLDCLPGDTLLLRNGYTFVPIADIRVGEKIWGYDKWSTVEATAYKGILPVDSVRMNNGSTFAATRDHLVYVRTCRIHPAAWGTGTGSPCSCDTEMTRVPVGDLQPGMVLTQPERLPFGDVEMDLGRAYVEGLYISDGWHQNTSFAISGQDGCPKEEQKREVEQICARLGITTSWYRKAIHILDREWTHRMHLMGGHAPEKHALDINLAEAEAASLLRGIMADSGANTNGDGRTFTTTSYQLMLQTRILHKMFGVSCGETFISNHGGLGKNPIWRLFVRAKQDARRAKFLRVKSIERAVAEVPVYDIQTDDHFIYLPHADVTVSNCDDMSQWLAAAILSVGGNAQFATVAFQRMMFEGQVQYSHVFTCAIEPRARTRIVLDPVAAEKTPQMLNRVKAARVWPPLS